MPEPRDPELERLLGQYARILRANTADSSEARHFVDQHRENGEFVELAAIARTLKKAWAIGPQ
jgi:hypothetical protein